MQNNNLNEILRQFVYRISNLYTNYLIYNIITKEIKVDSENMYKDFLLNAGLNSANKVILELHSLLLSNQKKEQTFFKILDQYKKHNPNKNINNKQIEDILSIYYSFTLDRVRDCLGFEINKKDYFIYSKWKVDFVTKLGFNIPDLSDTFSIYKMEELLKEIKKDYESIPNIKNIRDKQVAHIDEDVNINYIISDLNIDYCNQIGEVVAKLIVCAEFITNHSPSCFGDQKIIDQLDDIIKKHPHAHHH